MTKCKEMPNLFFFAWRGSCQFKAQHFCQLCQQLLACRRILQPSTQGVCHLRQMWKPGAIHRFDSKEGFRVGFLYAIAMVRYQNTKAYKGKGSPGLIWVFMVFLSCRLLAHPNQFLELSSFHHLGKWNHQQMQSNCVSILISLIFGAHSAKSPGPTPTQEVS